MTTYKDHHLRSKLKKEADEVLFSNMEMSDRVKERIRRHIEGEQTKRRLKFPNNWLIGVSALAAAVILIIVIPMLQPPSESDPVPAENPVVSTSPAPETPVDTGLSQLVTTPLNSIEEAKATFGNELRVPFVPENYTLVEMTAVGMKGEPARDIIFTYSSGDKTVTFAASRNDASFPAQMFSPIQVGDASGYVFEQPELIELFWMIDGVQYAITGPLSADEALQMAESLE